MPVKTVRASSQGLVRLKAALANKKWNMSDYRWSIAASEIINPSKDWEEHWQEKETFAKGCSKSTRERLLKGEAIRKQAFIAFCQALELAPYEIAKNPKNLGLIKLWDVDTSALIKLLSDRDNKFFNFCSQ